MKTNHRVVVTGLIGLMVVFFIYIGSPKNRFVAQGVLLPSKLSYAPTDASKVQVVSRISYPYQVLGQINIEMQYASQSSEQDVDSMLKKARQLAAAVGANAVIIRPSSIWHPNPSMLPLNQVHWVFRANAVKAGDALVPLAPGIVMPSN